MPIEIRALAVTSYDEATRTVEAVISTGAPVRRYDWVNSRFYVEELAIDATAVRLSRLQAGAPVLASHDQWSLDSILGRVESVRIERGQLVARLRFSERADVAPIVADVAAGIVRNVSVGYQVHRIERIAPESDDGVWTYRVIDWEPTEVSLVAVGADAGAQIRAGDSAGARSAGARTAPCIFIDQPARRADSQGAAMQTNQNPSAAGGDQAALDEARAEGARQEAERRRAILALDLPGIRGAVGQDFVRSLADNPAVTLEAARVRILNKMADLSEATNTRSVAYLDTWSNDPAAGGEGLHAGVRAALVEKLGGPRAPDQYRHLVRQRPVDYVRMLERARGVNPDLMTEGEIWGRAFHTSSDFANLMLAASRTRINMDYEVAPAALRRVASRGTVTDFQPHTRVRMSGFPQLRRVHESGEVKHGAMTAEGEQVRADTFATAIDVTRQLLINDQLGALSEPIRAISAAVIDLEARLLRDALTANAVMADGFAVFSTQHANLAATGAAISFATLDAGRRAMRLQRHVDGQTVIDAFPQYLVVPAALESVAEQQLATIAATQTAQVNPFGGRFELVVEPRLDAVSATAWYLAAAPTRVPGLEYIELDGSTGPVVEQFQDADVLGLKIRVYRDFGAAFVDFRSWYRNPGA